MAGQVQVWNPQLVDLLSADFINCWIPLEQHLLVETLATVEFTDVPQRFRSLVLIGQVRSDDNAELDILNLQFNSDTGNNYDYITVIHECSTTNYTCARATSLIRIGDIDAATARANNFTPVKTWLVGYSHEDREKWAFTDQSGSFGNVSVDADMKIAFQRGRWRNLSAITRLTLTLTNGNFVSGCHLALYGVL